MSDAVNVNSSPSVKPDFLAKAREAYGDALPEWVEELAKLADKTSAAAAARRVGIGSSTVTQIINGSYGAKDWSAIESRVRGVLMLEEVICPVLDVITKDHCLDEQGKKFTGTSAARTSLFHACRSGCPHSRIKGDANV